MEKERKVVWLENALIIMAIIALWPAILHWPERITRPLLYLALAAMAVIAWRRWRRLMNLKMVESDEVRHKGTKAQRHKVK